MTPADAAGYASDAFTSHGVLTREGPANEGVRALRVLHVDHTGYAGGAERALVRLLTAQREWRAALCAPRVEGDGDLSGGVPADDAFDRLAGHGVELDRDLPGLPGGGTRSSSPAFAARYYAALRACARALRRSPLFVGADVIHTNTAAAAIISALANRGRSVPLVVHLRDVVDTHSLGRAGFTAFTRLGLKHADGVIANARSTLESAEGLIPPNAAAAVIPSPIGIPHRVARPPVAGAPGPVRAIGMVGRLQHARGQHILLYAFAHLFRGTGVRAYFAGAPTLGEAVYADDLRALAVRLGIAEQVTFFGHVEDLAGFLDSIDILVHAAIRPEPLGQSVLQGLACGKPIIATEGGGSSEWIRDGENGLLVAPDSPDALAAALRALAESGDLRARLAAAAARTAGVLADDECAARHAQFFLEIVRASGRTGRPGVAPIAP
ncbi:hypothetical protein GCM10023322_73970 [Rugosimonospora acidiphila]|uniref:Uncharacterized protein n=1 Tax=Rugosimonospora acidiphila TaxID=556531 RepID=A0ABP9SQ08_9ACTN